MKTFKQYLNEIFQQHYKYTHKYNGGRQDIHVHKYHFTTQQGHQYSTNIFHGDKYAYVEFKHKGMKHDDKAGMGVTGTEKHHAQKVFSTVHHIIKHHLNKHPHLQSIEFSAQKEDGGRVKLYNHLANRFAHKHDKVNGLSDVTYIIHKHDIKE